MLKKRCGLVFLYFIMTLVMPAAIAFIPQGVSLVHAYTLNYYQVTSSGANNSNVDIAVDAAGMPHAVYLRSNFLYYRKCLCPEELIAYTGGGGWSCSIAIGPNDVPQVVFRKDALAWYTKRTGGAWQTTVQVSPVGSLVLNTVDIDVDAANAAHVIFDMDCDEDTLAETMYCNNAGGPFGVPVLIADSGGDVYSMPAIKMDSLNYYHIACVVDRLSENASCAAVFSDGPSGNLNSPWSNYQSVSLQKNCLAADPFGTPGTMRVIYEILGAGMVQGITTVTPALWVWSSVAPGSAPTIDSSGAIVGVTYKNSTYSTIELKEDTGAGYGPSQPINIGMKPVIAYGSINIYYTNNAGPAVEVYMAADPAAVKQPTLTTDNATGIGPDRATLNSTLDDEGGQACQYQFRYGTSAGVYTDNTSWKGSKISGQVFSDNITGLTLGTKYYYLAECQNSAGTGTGLERSFTTLSIPTVTTDNATSIMAKTAIVHGNLTSTGGQAATVAIFSGTSDSSWTRSDNFSSGSAGPFSLGVMGLVPNTTYFYRCYVENEAGGSWASSSVSFTTQANLGLWRNYWEGPGRDWYWFYSGGSPAPSPPPVPLGLWRNYWEGPGKDWWRFSSGRP